MVLKEKSNKTLRENTAAVFQTPLFSLPPCYPAPCSVLQFLGYMSLQQCNRRHRRLGSVLCCSFTAPCFLFNCSFVCFFISRSPFRVVAPSESTLSLCSGYDFPLAFLLLSYLSFLLLLCCHGLILFSSCCCSTVIFLGNNCPFLNMLLQKCQKFL